MLATEILSETSRKLTFEQQPLIGRKQTDKATDQPQVVAQQRETLDVGASVSHLDLALLPRPERQRGCDRSLHWTTSREGTTTIVDAGDEALLQRIGDVGSA